MESAREHCQNRVLNTSFRDERPDGGAVLCADARALTMDDVITAF